MHRLDNHLAFSFCHPSSPELACCGLFQNRNSGFCRGCCCGSRGLHRQQWEHLQSTLWDGRILFCCSKQEHLQLLHPAALLLSEERFLLRGWGRGGERAGALGRAAAVPGWVAGLPSWAGACLARTERVGSLPGKAWQVHREYVQVVTFPRAVKRLPMYFTPWAILHKSLSPSGSTGVLQRKEKTAHFIPAAFLETFLFSMCSLSSCIKPQYWYCNGLGPSSSWVLLHWVELPAALKYRWVVAQTTSCTTECNCIFTLKHWKEIEFVARKFKKPKNLVRFGRKIAITNLTFLLTWISSCVRLLHSLGGIR